MRHRYHYILYLLFGICLVSCGNNEPVDSPNTDRDMLLMLSRAGMTSGTTYGVMVYNEDTRYRYGNYTVNPVSNELIPYTEDNGELKLDYSKGVYIPFGTYKMVLTSPALAIVDKDIPSKKWTFKYVRKPEADYIPFYVSNAFSVNIYNRGEILDSVYYTSINLTNYHDIHLKERRSLFRLIIECGNKITQTRINDVKIDNLIKSAVYNPDTDCFEDDALAQVELEEDINLLTNGNLLLSHTGTESITIPYASSSEQTVDNKGYLYVLSQDYSETLSPGVFRHITPKVTIKFSDDAESTIPLDVNFEPHKRYTYKIVIQSYFIGVKLIIEPWNSGTPDGGIGTGVSDDNTSIIDIGNFSITPWESNTNDPQSTTIGGITN